MTDKNSGTGVRLLRIDAASDGQRIDNFLLRELKGVPRSRVYRLLRRGEVRVNRGRVKAEYKLQSGDEVRVPPVRMAEAGEAPSVSKGLAEQLAAAILYEDDGLLVVAKPAGLAVHGGSGVSFGLIEALRVLRPEARFLELVHRLDRDTSGCLMVAKKRTALTELHAALREGRVDKRYLALALGKWPRHRGRIEAPLEKNILQSGERMVRVSVQGKPALTEFRVVEEFGVATLVEARPITGRTHQIRVHARHAGHPLAGDDKYGDRTAEAPLRELGLKRLCLHAHQLILAWEGRQLTLQAEPPADFEHLLTSLRNRL